jgi:hypothetical protein
VAPSVVVAVVVSVSEREAAFGVRRLVHKVRPSDRAAGSGADCLVAKRGAFVGGFYSLLIPEDESIARIEDIDMSTLPVPEL